ncbi:zinc carboxypeptidase [Pontibacter ummariensis]|uniref:Zinc carboxypeptidase n=1 Tax=Pontibacter ummariensis TaxID=1610492 RepID=A0A239L845_9BACT|nr:M14 family metallopeptidase [Pontibacter ummariensis]PRY04004.1 zinc carboxypeptidase [Pontibacter ummariensis]SNT26807.1 Zinc carboxypeptidase [Pontibacter ummariensis]
MLTTILLATLLATGAPTQGKPDLKTPYEKGNGNQTATYDEAIQWYEKLDEAYDEVKMLPYGTTDVGRPLHLVVVNTDKDFNPESVRQKDKRVLLIQNGIHPGEPEGIDATMMLVRDYLQDKKLRKQLDNVVLAIIPVYNIGGALNRNSHTRTNQNGPESYGFRGNARNLDLNRDFIKMDSRNAQTFHEIFREWDPDVFMDNHTSNGADYQHVMTLIATQHNKLNPTLAKYLSGKMVPTLYQGMKQDKFPMVPYMNHAGETPDDGIIGFMESPRYATGYTALYNTLGFVPETHMLKPFDQRVKATYKLMENMIETVHRDAKEIGELRAKAKQETLAQQKFPLDWRLDTTEVSQIPFLGYEAKYKPSDVSGLDRLYYDRKSPYSKMIKYYDEFKPTVTVEKPVAYVIPQAWHEVIDRLKTDRVQMQQLKKDTTLTLDTYYIKDYKTGQRPYEGHYLHSDVQVETKRMPRQFYKGDYVVYLNQPANRFIVEVLEPQATDSYFNWNFFDSILMQKEYFSSYVFEDLAADILKQNPALRKKLEEMKKLDPDFAKNARAQLDFVYRNSPHYEFTHMMYPVGRLTQDLKLPL